MGTRQYLVFREREFAVETIDDLCVRYGVSGWYYAFVLGGQRAFALYAQDVRPPDGSVALAVPLPLVPLAQQLFGPAEGARWKPVELAARIAEDYQRPILLVGVADSASTAFAVRFAESRFAGAEAVIENQRFLTLDGEHALESRGWPAPPDTPPSHSVLANRAVGAFLEQTAFPYAFDHLESGYHDGGVVDVG